MYIEKYWANYIGGTDDSLTLIDYLYDKGKTEISLNEIFNDTGLSRLNWNFHTSPDLEYIDSEGLCYEFYYAIDLVTDLAALILESKKSGGFNIKNLYTIITRQSGLVNRYKADTIVDCRNACLKSVTAVKMTGLSCFRYNNIRLILFRVKGK